jgi:glucosyl-dolichyl phosphate glucuronosyltransferase
MSFFISLIIPTLNRPIDLGQAVKSVLKQSRLPDELIIIDQSINDESHKIIRKIWPDNFKTNLLYTLDPSIKGLVNAKKYSLDVSKGDIVCFIEDDIILESDYLYEIENGFSNKTNMLGCCGIITNPPKKPWLYNYVFHIFHIGIFSDKRVGIFGNFTGNGHSLINSNVISGGASAWKVKVFSEVQFDVKNDFHMVEDIEFSTRVENYFGKQLYINPNARLAHNPSPINRGNIEQTQKKKVYEYILFYKKRRLLYRAVFDLVWLMVGILFESVYNSLSEKSIKPLRGSLHGLIKGINKNIITNK